MMVVRIEERGISVMGRWDGARSDASESPVERFGSLILVAATRIRDRHIVRIRSTDAPEIFGEVCVRATTLHPSDRIRIRAAQSFASAGTHVHAQDWEAAFEDLRSAARDYDDIGLARPAAETRHAMAELAYRRLDHKRDSFALGNEALATFRAQRDLIFIGLLTQLQAKALLDMPGSNPRAIAGRVRSLLAEASRADSSSPYGARELPRLEIMRGFLEYRLDAPARARALFMQAAQTCQHLRDRDCYAIASQNLALLAEADSNYAFALAAYGEALRTLGPDLDPKLAADIWNNLGRLQGVVGLFSRSASSQTVAMRDYARLQDCPGVRRALSRSGNLLVQIGSLADAESDLQQAASLRCPDLLAYAATLTDPTAGGPAPVIADEPVHTGTFGLRPARAALCADPLEPGSLTNDNKAIVFNSLLSLGDALMFEGETRQAQSCLQQAQRYAATSRSEIRLQNARGSALLLTENAPAARAAFQQALRIADDAKLPAAYEHRGTAQLGIARAALLAGAHAEALRDAGTALQSSASRGDIDQTVSALRLIAAAHRASGSEPAAARTLQVAADLIEAVPIDELDGEKRATYLATQHAVFAELTDLFASHPGAAEAWTAFATSERGRARSLRYAELQQARDLSAPTQAPPAARYQQLLREVVQLPAREATGGSALLDELDDAAVHERGAGDPLDRKRLTQALGQLDATLVEYAAGTHDMFAFVVDSNDIQVIRLGDRREIAETVGELRDRLRDSESPPDVIRSDAARLARLVLWPLTAHLPRRRILFVPDDALHTVPFDVLPWSSDPAEQLLLQHAEVSIVPSASFLVHARRLPARGPAPRIALLGDPVFRISDWRRECALSGSVQSARQRLERTASDWTDSLPRLPGSRQETLMIARLARQAHAGSQIETLLGCAAVPSALKAAASGDLELLHIATHARIDAQRPRLSALALTPQVLDGRPVSMFGLLDILGLKLNSSLVVLSACETSRGRLLPGEGVLGPAQAFLQAGAATVLASYWRIDDQATAAFMQRFYRHLLLEHLPVAAALRQTQLEESASSASHDWAAFALYGWPDSSV